MGAIYYYQNKQKYQICVIPKYFLDFEKDVEKNIFDYNFLFWYHTKLCKELIKLFDHKKGCVESFQGECKFRRCDWYTGEYWSINLQTTTKKYKLIGSNERSCLCRMIILRTP